MYRRGGKGDVVWGHVFFFKQKTAYEIKECDWSSDVCSSDLAVCVVEIELIVPKQFSDWDGFDEYLDDGIDVENQTHCPRCGFGPCDILKAPDPAGRWSRIGKARCPHCGAKFNITAHDEDDSA